MISGRRGCNEWVCSRAERSLDARNYLAHCLGPPLRIVTEMSDIEKYGLH